MILRCGQRRCRRDGSGSPGVEEAQHLGLVIALALFQKTGVLNVQHLSIRAEQHKHREAEALWIAQTRHQGSSGLGLLLASRLARIVIHMYVDKVIVHHFSDVAVFADEVGKAQAPRAPVAAHLAHYKLLAV